MPVTQGMWAPQVLPAARKAARAARLPWKMLALRTVAGREPRESAARATRARAARLVPEARPGRVAHPVRAARQVAAATLVLAVKQDAAAKEVAAVTLVPLALAARPDAAAKEAATLMEAANRPTAACVMMSSRLTLA